MKLAVGYRKGYFPIGNILPFHTFLDDFRLLEKVSKSFPMLVGKLDMNSKKSDEILTFVMRYGATRPALK